MTIRPCPPPCGRVPSLIHRTLPRGFHVVQIECTCGKRGAHVMFTKLIDREKCEQAVTDGWNLAP